MFRVVVVDFHSTNRISRHCSTPIGSLDLSTILNRIPPPSARVIPVNSLHPRTKRNTNRCHPERSGSTSDARRRTQSRDLVSTTYRNAERFSSLHGDAIAPDQRCSEFFRSSELATRDSGLTHSAFPVHALWTFRPPIPSDFSRLTSSQQNPSRSCASGIIVEPGPLSAKIRGNVRPRIPQLHQKY